MATIYSTFDHTMKIPPNFKGLAGKGGFTKEFKAGEPVEVPDKIAAYYTKNWSKKYKYAQHIEAPPFYTPEEEKEPEPPKVFEPLEFLDANYNNIEEALEKVEKREDLLALAKFLRLGSYFKQKNERIKERIIADIKAKKAQQEKLDKQSAGKAGAEE